MYALIYKIVVSRTLNVSITNFISSYISHFFSLFPVNIFYDSFPPFSPSLVSFPLFIIVCCKWRYMTAVVAAWTNLYLLETFLFDVFILKLLQTKSFKAERFRFNFLINGYFLSQFKWFIAGLCVFILCQLKSA